MTEVTSAKRFTRGKPCPVCSGFDELDRGKGERCGGFIGSDGRFAHCSREEHSGSLPQENGGTYAHLLTGPCKCGTAHGTRIGGGEKIGSSSSNGATGEPARYVYVDESGGPLFRVNIIGHDSAKRIWQEHWDGAGWTKGLNGCRRVLFHLTELLNAYVAVTVWLVEGERDVETLTKRGHLATCNPMGAGKWGAVADLARTVLARRCVRVIADGDDVGRKHASEVKASLRGAAADVVVLECTKGKDVTEHLANGGTLDERPSDGLVPMQDTPASPRVDAQQDAPRVDAPRVELDVPDGDCLAIRRRWAGVDAPRVELDVPDDDAHEPDGDVDGSFPPPPSDAPPAPKPEPPSGGNPAPSVASGTQHPVTLAQAFEARRKRGPLVRMSTGIEGIDLATCGGIPFGSTVFVVGAPDAAKTLLLFSIAVTWARQGTLVGFMAVDEELDDLVTRLAQQTAKDVSAEGEITHFSRSDYEAGDPEVVDHIEEQIGPLPILFFDPAWTVERATAHLADEGKRLGKRSAFFADSLQTVRSEATRDDASERRVVADNAKAVRQAAVRFGIATLATSESNREYSKGKRKGEAAIAMSAGAESRAVEYQSRALFVLSAVEDSNLIEVEIPKNKLGPRKTFHLAIDRATQTLSDAPSPENPAKDPNSRAKAHMDRLLVQSEETAKRKADKKAEAERDKAAEVAERKTTQERTLVEILRANPGGLVTRDLKAKLKGLGSLTSGDELVIAERLGDAVRHGPAPKPAHHLAKLFVLVEDKLPPHLRQGAPAVKEEAGR